MELTKQQIQFIDNRLENEGIKYWDIRIEMLDHVVSDVEKRTKLGEKFEDAVQNSFYSLGFNGSFESFILIKQKQFTKLYRKTIKRELKKFFTSFYTLLSYAIILYSCYFFADEKLFGKTFLAVFLISFCMIAIFGLFNYSKVFKSVNMLASFNFLVLLISLLNCFIYVPKIYLNAENFSPIHFSIIAAVLYPFIFVGYKIFINSYLKTNNIYLKLMKL